MGEGEGGQEVNNVYTVHIVNIQNMYSMYIVQCTHIVLLSVDRKE